MIRKIYKVKNIKIIEISKHTMIEWWKFWKLLNDLKKYKTVSMFFNSLEAFSYLSNCAGSSNKTKEDTFDIEESSRALV